jgi:hypothetical protein
MRALLAAVLVTTLAIAPGVASASHGQLHGPSSTPLLLELTFAAAVVVGLLGRHAIARGVRSVAHSATHGVHALARHRPHRRI